MQATADTVSRKDLLEKVDRLETEVTSLRRRLALLSGAGHLPTPASCGAEALPVIDYGDHPAYRPQTPFPDAAVAAATAAVLPFIAEKRRNIGAALPLFRARAASCVEPEADMLATQGAVAIHVPAKGLAAIRALTGAGEDALRWVIAGRNRRRLRFRETQIVVHGDFQPVPGMEEMSACIEDVLRDSGAFAIAEAVFPGCTAVMGRTVFRINVPGQPFFADPFGNGTFEAPKATGFHIDANARPAINGTLYLDETGPDQGPFSMVAGSNRWLFDPDDRAIRKAMDDRLVRGEFARLFSALPGVLQRKANFGHDLQDESPASRLFLEDEIIFPGEAGTLVLFDPEGVHRGGNVYKGERVAIVFGLRLAVGS